MTEKNFTVGVKREIYHARLRQLRQAHGLSQMQLADLCNLTTARVQAIEQIKVFPREPEAFAIADFFNLPSEVLFPRWSQGLFSRGRRLKDATIAVSRVALTAREVMRLEAPQTEETVIQQREMTQAITAALQFLSPREQKILRMRFGLDHGRSHDLEAVGREFGVTRERIRQLEAKALERLKKNRQIDLAALIQPPSDDNVPRQKAVKSIMRRFAISSELAAQILTRAEDRSLTIQSAYDDFTQTQESVQ